MGNPLREGARRARVVARRLTPGWAAREGFSQEGLLAERTISPPRPPPATRQPEPRAGGRAEESARDDMVSARVLDLEQRARLRRRGERDREPGRDRTAEECA